MRQVHAGGSGERQFGVEKVKAKEILFARRIAASLQAV
jgi:hypothetical protein